MRSWATRPLFTCPPRIARVLTVVGLVLILSLVVTPAYATLYWHLWHGTTIACRGENIFVPLRWIANTNDNLDVSITKLPFTVFAKSPVDGMIVVGRFYSPLNKEKEEHYKSFEKLYWNLAVANATISGPIRTGTGDHETFCMESTYSGVSDHVDARCLIHQGQWDADFFGDKRDLETFFEIIQKIN